VTGDGAALRLADGQVVANASLTGTYQLGIRPEDIVVDGKANGHVVRAALRFREDLGSHSVLAADLGGSTVRIATPFGADIADRLELDLNFPTSRLHLFDAATGRAIPGAFGAQ